MFIGSQRFIEFKMWVPRKKVWETLLYKYLSVYQFWSCHQGLAQLIKHRPEKAASAVTSPLMCSLPTRWRNLGNFASKRWDIRAQCWQKDSYLIREGLHILRQKCGITSFSPGLSNCANIYNEYPTQHIMTD